MRVYASGAAPAMAAGGRVFPTTPPTVKRVKYGP
jgi:hypothetical protein